MAEQAGRQGAEPGTGAQEASGRPAARRRFLELGRPTPKDVTSGLVTGLFSIPEGMAYASIGGFNPVMGLYSGMVPTIVGSFLSRTVLMVTTLTSAIALTSKSVLSAAGLDDTVGNVAMLTVLTGAVMVVFGLARFGNLMRFVSNSVMTGFTTGIALQIVVGVLKDATGYSSHKSNTLAKLGDVVVHLPEWNWTVLGVAAATVAVYAVAHAIKPLRSVATLIALAVVSVAVVAASIDVDQVGDLGAVPQALPLPQMPDWSAASQLLLGSVAVALVALAQAAGIGAAVPNPDGSKPDVNRDFLAQGAANIAGGFFQALPTGGSLSRTGVAVSAGARTRWSGIFSGLWLAGIVLVAGKYAQYIPMPVIGGLVLVIGAELLAGRWKDIVLVLRAAPLSAVAMIVTFLATTQLPLQQAILIGALLSLILACIGMARDPELVALRPDSQGSWQRVPVPQTMRSGSVTVLYYSGAMLFAELAKMIEHWPSFAGASRSALVMHIGTFGDVPSTSVVATLVDRAREVQASGNRLILCGIDERGLRFLQRSHALEAIGPQNVYAHDAELLGSLRRAYDDAVAWVAGGDPPTAGSAADDRPPSR